MDYDLVRLKCFKVGNRLRIRIISLGYNPDSNCQFPKAIREDGREYTVPKDDITFAESSNHKFFYRIKKNNIKIVEVQDDFSGLKIYGDEKDTDCCICMNLKKDSIFYPCGHYYCCGTCANTLQIMKGICPICRAVITQIIGHDQLQ